MEFAIRGGAIYRVNVPGTDIEFCCVWTGRVRPNPELECEDFEFAMVDGSGSTFVVPTPCLQDMTIVSAADDASSN